MEESVPKPSRTSRILGVLVLSLAVAGCEESRTVPSLWVCDHDGDRVLGLGATLNPWVVLEVRAPLRVVATADGGVCVVERDALAWYGASGREWARERPGRVVDVAPLPGEDLAVLVDPPGLVCVSPSGAGWSRSLPGGLSFLRGEGELLLAGGAAGLLLLDASRPGVPRAASPEAVRDAGTTSGAGRETGESWWSLSADGRELRQLSRELVPLGTRGLPFVAARGLADAGGLWLAEEGIGRLHRLGPTGEPGRVVELDSEVQALARRGSVLFALLPGAVVRIDLETGSVTTQGGLDGALDLAVPWAQSP